MVQNINLQRLRSYVKINGTIRFLDLKNIDLDTKITTLSNLVQKLLVKPDFCKMMANITHSGTSHAQTS